MAEADDWNTLQANAVAYLESIITPTGRAGDLTTQEIATYLLGAFSANKAGQPLEHGVATALILTLLNRVYDLENA
jgi:hypothetical protein